MKEGGEKRWRHELKRVIQALKKIFVSREHFEKRITLQLPQKLKLMETQAFFFSDTVHNLTLVLRENKNTGNHIPIQSKILQNQLSDISIYKRTSPSSEGLKACCKR